MEYIVLRELLANSHCKAIIGILFSQYVILCLCHLREYAVLLSFQGARPAWSINRHGA